jgi:hypothetical protein
MAEDAADGADVVDNVEDPSLISLSSAYIPGEARLWLLCWLTMYGAEESPYMACSKPMVEGW